VHDRTGRESTDRQPRGSDSWPGHSRASHRSPCASRRLTRHNQCCGLDCGNHQRCWNRGRRRILRQQAGQRSTRNDEATPSQVARRESPSPSQTTCHCPFRTAEFQSRLRPSPVAGSNLPCGRGLGRWPGTHLRHRGDCGGPGDKRPAPSGHAVARALLPSYLDRRDTLVVINPRQVAVIPHSRTRHRRKESARVRVGGASEHFLVRWTPLRRLSWSSPGLT
jgi:hypothetical protein